MKILVLTALFTLAALSGCNNKSEPPSILQDPAIQQGIGKECVVKYKSKLLGGAANRSMPPTTQIINDRIATITGKLIQVEIDGALIQQSNSKNETSEYWIPKSAILLIEIK